MRINEILKESADVLYHKTTTQGLNGMVHSGKLDVSSAGNVDPDFDYNDYGHVSLTRNPDWWHFNDLANAVMITVDAGAVRKLADVQSYAWQSNLQGHTGGPARDEQEERVAQAIPFTNQYIKRVNITDYPEEIEPSVLKRLTALHIPFRLKITENYISNTHQGAGSERSQDQRIMEKPRTRKHTRKLKDNIGYSIGDGLATGSWANSGARFKQM